MGAGETHGAADWHCGVQVVAHQLTGDAISTHVRLPGGDVVVLDGKVGEVGEAFRLTLTSEASS